MKTALKLGFVIFVIIQIYLATDKGSRKFNPTDKDYDIEMPIDSSPKPNFDTARHYKIKIEPYSKKHKVIDVNPD